MVGLINIENRLIGSTQPCFIIAEAGVNHNGDIELAKRLVDAAVLSKADAIKFQTFKAENLVTTEAPKAEYQKTTTNVGESQFDMLKNLELSFESHQVIKSYCQDQGILFLSSPFDEDSADLLSKLDVAAFKIPSGEITNVFLLAHIARKGKPMIVSTGMCNLGEVDAAVRVLLDAGNKNFVLLHCVSNYPTNPDDVNLRAMLTMREAFNAPVGFSDHTLGIEIPIAAVALGACVIEKHLTLDKTMDGPDHRASLEPDEFLAMVSGIRSVEASLGDGRKEPAISELEVALVARKSLVAIEDILNGDELTRESVGVKRPGSGLPPSVGDLVYGRTAREFIPKGSLIRLDMLS